MNPDPDPAFQVNLDPDPGFGYLKTEKKIHQKNFFRSLFIKNYNLLIPRPLDRMASYRRSLQLSKENNQYFKKLNLLTFFLFLWVIFALLDPDPDLDCESGSGYGS